MTLMEAVAPDHESRRKLATLLRITRALALELRLEPLLELMVGEVASAMQAERATLFVVDAARPGELVSRVTVPIAQEIRVAIGSGIAGATAETRRAINLPDAHADPRFNPAFDRASGFRTRSLLSVPILSPEGGLLGVVQALNRSGGAFTAADEEFLQAIAGQLGVALERAAAVDALLHAQSLRQSLDLAREIQRGLLPQALPSARDGADVWAVLEPVYEVGGDLYDCFLLDAGRLCFMIGDVSGKGIAAALFMAMARTAFKMAALAAPHSIGQALAHVNDFLCGNNSQSMFVTAAAGVLDLRTGVLRWADAGHEPPLRISGSGDVARVEKSGGMVLGLLPGQAYADMEMQLQPGETLLLFTDGVSEAMRADGGFYGLEAAMAALHGAGAGADSRTLVEALIADVRRFAAGARPSDDITALAIRYRGR